MIMVPLSLKADKIIERAKFYGIHYRVDKYYGDDMYFGGWTDFGDGSYIESSDDELEDKYKNCGCGGVKSQHLYDGKVFLCGLQFKLFLINEILPKRDEYLDLFDDSISIDEKKKIISGFYKKPLTACRHCNSINAKLSKRYTPAEQLP